MQTADALRILVIREDNLLVAQCLEHDICTQAEDMKTLRKRMDLLIEAELAEKAEIAPAPPHFHKMWAEAEAFANGKGRYQMALAA